MQLDREYILRMIKGRSAGAVVVEGGEGGGGGGSVALGPLLTSLNAEAMPTAEGYLHWTGSAWAFDTPTGGDPVDLTPYALKTWVQDNFAYKSDLTGLLTKSDADGYYAPISFVKPYLPLVAGSNYPLTGSLYITGNAGITWVGGYGMLCLKPTSGWAGVTENQWGVGSHSAQGVIRSSLELKRYDGTYQYTIWDTSNFDPLNYISKDGGTVAGTLNVRTQLNIQSAAGANKISIDGTTPNIDIASGGQLTFDVDSHIAHDATNDRLVIHGNNGLLIDSDTYVGTVDGGNQVATRNYVGSQLELFDNYVWQRADNRYLKLIGGTMTGNLVMNGASVTFGPSGSLAAIGYSSNALQIRAAAVAVASDGVFTFNGDQIATQTWVLNQGYITEATADGRYLPLTAGSSKPLTDTLYIANNKGLYIKDTDGTGRMAVFMNNLNQFFVGFGMRQGGYEGYFDSNIIYLRTGLTGTTMTLDASRNVGIGTTSPAYKLDVSGVIKATEGVMVRDANGNRVGLGIDGLLMMYPSSGSSASAYVMSFEYDASGSWPMVKTKFSARPQVITGQSGSTYTYTNVALTSDLAGYATQQWVGQQGYITESTANGRYLPLTAGSSKPLTGDLWLNGNLVAGNPDNTTNDDSAKIAFYTNKNYPNISPYIQAINENNYGRKRLSVFQKNVADWDTPQVEVFTIKPNGNVGIGTNAPDYKLDVSGVIRATEGMMVRNGSSDAIGIDTTGVFFNKAQEGGSPIPASIFSFTWDNDAQNVIVSKNGNMTVTGKLAVGTTSFDGSNAKLQVGGNMFATGSITSKSSAGSVSLANGNISATNLYISTVVFGTSNNDPAIYIGNGHVYARNSQGQTTMII